LKILPYTKYELLTEDETAQCRLNTVLGSTTQFEIFGDKTKLL